MKAKIILPIVVLCATHLCCCSAGPSYRTVSLADGKTIKLIDVIPIHYSSGETSLMLKYQTDLKVGDSIALRKEADDIWSSFQHDAEKAEVRTAIISANEVPEGTILKQSHGYEFVYTRDADGVWHCRNDQRSTQ